MRRIRLVLDGSPRFGFTDLLQDAPPVVWDGDAVNMQVFLSDLSAREESFELETITGITLELREDEQATETLIDPVSPEDEEGAACAFEQFETDDGQHFEFVLSGGDLNFSLNTSRFWASFRATTATGGVTFGAGYVKVIHSGHTGTSGASVSSWTESNNVVSYSDENGSYQFDTVEAGSGSAAGTFTVVDSKLEFTLNGKNLQADLVAGGTGAPANTVITAASLAALTYDESNYVLPVVTL